MSASLRPCSARSLIFSSNPPALMMSAMMIGLLVAPVAPIARFFFTCLGSIESSQTFVPVEVSCLSDMMRPPCVVGYAQHSTRGDAPWDNREAAFLSFFQLGSHTFVLSTKDDKLVSHSHVLGAILSLREYLLLQ